MVEQQLSKFVAQTIMRLACDSRIDHRNDFIYNNKASKLFTYFQSFDIETSIYMSVKDYMEDDSIQYENNSKLYKLLYPDYIQEEIDEDNLFEEKLDLFHQFIRYIGIYEVLSLHGDEQDQFQDEFIKIIY